MDVQTYADTWIRSAIKHCRYGSKGSGGVVAQARQDKIWVRLNVIDI